MGARAALSIFMKTNNSFSPLPRSRALEHVPIMRKGRHDPDDKVDKAHRCQEYRRAVGDVEYV
jgi:hypothetical protein